MAEHNCKAHKRFWCAGFQTQTQLLVAWVSLGATMCTQDPICSQFTQRTQWRALPGEDPIEAVAASTGSIAVAGSSVASRGRGAGASLGPAVPAKLSAGSTEGGPALEPMSPCTVGCLPASGAPGLGAVAEAVAADLNAGPPMSLCTQSPAPDLPHSQRCSQVFQEPLELLRTAAVRVAESEARRVLGWPGLRSFQRSAVEAWAAGKHCFLLSGTGSGKTACFVLPTLVARCWHQRAAGPLDGPRPLALVVSPLVALMRDQVARLRDRGVEAAVCSPQCNDPTAWCRSLNGEVVICYMSPELLVRLADSGELARVLRVSLLAVDEAHCVSEWGFDFRPEYGQLRRVAAAVATAGYGGRAPPVICCTATCTADVRGDVLHSLGLAAEQTELITGTMNRPNLHFAVEEWPDQARMQRRLLELFGVSLLEQSAVEARRRSALDRAAPSERSLTIVYAQRKADCDQLARLLEAGGVQAAAFHSGVAQEARQRVQQAFYQDELQAVVATVAFGMGIDKPDVRRVLHFGLPSSLEAYTQESGRAGRDGRLARCIILCSPRDRCRREMAIMSGHHRPGPGLQRTLLRLHMAFTFCRNRRHCRRAQLLEYLGEDPCDHGKLGGSQELPSVGTPGFCVRSMVDGLVHCGSCDVCCTPRATKVCDLRQELGALLQLLAARERERGPVVSRAQLVEAGLGLEGYTRGLNREGWQRLLDAAIGAGCLELRCPENCQGTPLYALTDAGRHRSVTGADVEAFWVDLGEHSTWRERMQMPAWEQAGRGTHGAAVAEGAAAVPGVPTSRSWFSSVVRWRESTLQHHCRGSPAQAGTAAVAAAGATPLATDAQQLVQEVSPQTARSSVSAEAESLVRFGTHPAQQRGSLKRQPSRAEAEAGITTVRRLHSPGTSRPPLDSAGARQVQNVVLVDYGRPPRRLRRSGSSGQPPESVLSQEQVRGPPVAHEVFECMGTEHAQAPELPCSPFDAQGQLLGHAVSPPVVKSGLSAGSHADGSADATASAVAALDPARPADGVACARALHGTPAAPATATRTSAARDPPGSPATSHGQRQEVRSSASLPLAQGLAGPARLSTSAFARPSSERLAVQRRSGGPAQKSSRRGRRTRFYTEAERRAAPPLLAKLMEAADFNSNVTGGSVAWKLLLREARALAPPEARPRLNEVFNAFKSNTPGIHGIMLDELIAEWGGVPCPAIRGGG